MATTITTLHEDFKRYFGITNVHWVKHGGQKHVYCVTRNNSNCILKIYKDFNARDIREIEIYKKFSYLPGIPKLISVDSYQGDTVSFEHCIEGECLDVLQLNYKGESKLIANLLIKVCQIMIPMWESSEQIVHRDFKPANLIIGSNNNPTVIDFGIAKDNSATTVTSTFFQPNSWPFAAPEQYESQKDQIQYRTDFFSLGAVGYFLYYEALPFGNQPSLIAANFKDKSYKIKYDKDCTLKPFFSEALNVSIAERPRTASEMIKLLNI